MISQHSVQSKFSTPLHPCGGGIILEISRTSGYVIGNWSHYSSMPQRQAYQEGTLPLDHAHFSVAMKFVVSDESTFLGP